MRITNRMISDRVLFNIQTSLKRIAKLHDQLSSGYKVRYPSDDAVVATRASNIGAIKREIDQFKRNVDHVKNYVNAYDSVLREISGIYHRIRELLIRGANGTMSQDERMAIAHELEKILDSLAGIANMRIGEERIFGGADFDKDPVEKVSGYWTIVLDPDANISRKVKVLGYKLEYGLTVYDLFRTDNGVDVFQMLRDTIDVLKKNPQDVEEHLSNISLKQLSLFEDKLMENIAKVGASMKVMEFLETRTNDLKIFITEYLSKEMDADITEVLTDLSMQQAVLQAALKSAARVIQNTLVDYVR